MAIYDSGDRIEKWRYAVKEFKVLVNGESIEIPKERISYISIVDDYLSNLYPIFQLQFVLSSDTYYEIQKYKNSLKIYLRIDKFYYYEDKTKRADLSQSSCYKPWINDTFDIILDANTENMNAALEREEMQSDYTIIKKDNSDELDKVVNGVTVYLYKVTNELKTNVNKIFTGVNVTDVIAWLLTQAKIKNVIMQQPDNTKRYDTFVVPPLSISKALYWIDTYYGIYKLGTIFFVDFDYFYIIPFDGSNRKAFIRNDTTTTNFVFPSSESKSHSNEPGVLKKVNKDTSNYIVGIGDTLNISNSSISNDLIAGSDSTSIDSFSGSSTTAESGATTKTNKKTQAITTNITENEFYDTMKAAIAKSLSTEISFTVTNYDIDMIKPNKTFSVLFEDSAYTKKYTGKYTIVKATHAFSREGEALMLQSTIILRKMK